MSARATSSWYRTRDGNLRHCVVGWCAVDQTPRVSASSKVDGNQILAISSLLALAFQFDPLHVWLYPNERQRLARLRREYERDIMGRDDLAVLHQVGSLGAAIWCPPGASSRSTAGCAMSGRFRGAFPSHPLRLRQLVRDLRKGRPEEPHWYLSQLAVDAPRRGQGIGRELLNAGIEQSDAAGVGVYLETTNPLSLPFFRSAGFAQVGKLSLSGTPDAWRLWRASR